MDDAIAEELWTRSPDAIVAVGRDGRLTHWNRAAEIIVGVSQAKMLGPTLHALEPETVRKKSGAPATSSLRAI